MRFTYRSTKGYEKEINPVLLADIRDHLEKEIGPLSYHTTMGQVHDALLSFRDKDGSRLLINILEPLFVYVGGFGQLWPKEEINV